MLKTKLQKINAKICDEILVDFRIRSGALLPQASLHCCGLLVSSPGLCASSGGRFLKAFFMVFLLDSKGAKVRKKTYLF